jgi:hypothetical protein
MISLRRFHIANEITSGLMRPSGLSAHYIAAPVHARVPSKPSLRTRDATSTWEKDVQTHFRDLRRHALL